MHLSRISRVWLHYWILDWILEKPHSQVIAQSESQNQRIYWVGRAPQDHEIQLVTLHIIIPKSHTRWVLSIYLSLTSALWIWGNTHCCSPLQSLGVLPWSRVRSCVGWRETYPWINDPLNSKDKQTKAGDCVGVFLHVFLFQVIISSNSLLHFTSRPETTLNAWGTLIWGFYWITR